MQTFLDGHLMAQAASPPIVVVDGHDVTIYPTVEDACLAMEAVDVQMGVYRAFDSRGQALRPAMDSRGESVAGSAAQTQEKGLRSKKTMMKPESGGEGIVDEGQSKARRHREGIAVLSAMAALEMNATSRGGIQAPLAVPTKSLFFAVDVGPREAHEEQAW